MLRHYKFQFLQLLKTLKSCLAIADILQATENIVHTQLSSKSVTKYIRSHGFFFGGGGGQYMYLQIPFKV